jgi:hypothetical protein
MAGAEHILGRLRPGFALTARPACSLDDIGYSMTATVDNTYGSSSRRSIVGNYSALQSVLRAELAELTQWLEACPNDCHQLSIVVGSGWPRPHHTSREDETAESGAPSWVKVSAAQEWTAPTAADAPALAPDRNGTAADRPETRREDRIGKIADGGKPLCSSLDAAVQHEAWWLTARAHLSIDSRKRRASLALRMMRTDNTRNARTVIFASTARRGVKGVDEGGRQLAAADLRPALYLAALYLAALLGVDPRCDVTGVHFACRHAA